MKTSDVLKKNRLLTVVVIIYLALFMFMPEKGISAWRNSMYYVFEMLLIMPVVLILTALIQAWVPRDVIMRGLGAEAGFKGNVLAFLLGSFSAGPIYAAFPVCKTLLQKGAGIANIVIVLSTWAVVKVPMLANEAKFLGPDFMLMRWVLTTIAIFIMAYVMAKFVKKEDLPSAESATATNSSKIRIEQDYCMGCGLCAKIRPDIFTMYRQKATVREDIDLTGLQAEVATIARRCPAHAIICQSPDEQ